MTADFQINIDRFNKQAQASQARIIRYREELARINKKQIDLLEQLEKEEALLKYSLDTIIDLCKNATR